MSSLKTRDWCIDPLASVLLLPAQIRWQPLSLFAFCAAMSPDGVASFPALLNSLKAAATGPDATAAADAIARAVFTTGLATLTCARAFHVHASRS